MSGAEGRSSVVAVDGVGHGLSDSLVFEEEMSGIMLLGVADEDMFAKLVLR